MSSANTRHDEPLRLFLCGDVMLGRGIDQILPHPSQPRLYEAYVRDARDYLALAEAHSGPIPHPAPLDYVWGDALAELSRRAPELRLINLETSITRRDEYWPGKGINYRMHPANVPCLTVAGIDGCVLANNHVLDWGYEGLRETLDSLHSAGLVTAGAGANLAEAAQAAIFELNGDQRVVLFAFADVSSGVPSDWAAGPTRPGVNLLADLSDATVDAIAARTRAARRPGDVVIASIHWGSNWGYRIPEAQRCFAHALIDRGGVDLVHGHSSHHPRPIEVYRDRLILYGCGDFINDYEGIGGYEEFRGELCLMYFPLIDRNDGRLLALDLQAMRIERFRLRRADAEERRWLSAVLSQVGRPLHTAVELSDGGDLALRW